MSNLTKRILVAIITIPITIYVSFMPYSLLGLTLIFALVAVHEFYGLAKMKGFIPQTRIGLILTAFIVISFAHAEILRAAFGLGMHVEVATLTLFFLPIVMIAGVLLTMTAELFKGYPNPLAQVSVTLAGAVYVGFGLGGFYGIREVLAGPSGESIEGPIFLITLLASIWICDSAAFSVGRKWGKHKIAAKVSPHKSWEGGIAGFVAAIIVWLVARTYISDIQGISLATALAMGIIVGVLGQIGDFAESMLKRDAGVKDSSTLIPGHGGVLDRIDSILFVAPCAYLWLHLVGI